MAVTTTLRFGLTQWSSGTDTYVRTQVHDSLGQLEAKAAGFIQDIVQPIAGSEYEGYIFFNTVTNQFYYCDGTQWWEVAGGTGTFDTAVNLTMSDTVGAEGVSTKAARSDHIHGLDGFGSVVAVGTALDAGTGEQTARANHIHSLGTGAVNSPSIFAAGVVGTAAIVDNAVSTAKITDLAVTNSKLAGSAVTTTKLKNLSVTQVKLADLAASGAKVGSVDTSKVTSGVFNATRIPTLDASKITSGTMGDTFIPDAVLAPTGMISLHASGSAPSGEWLLCDGSAVSRATYSNLDTLLSAQGYPFGNGDGATTFNLPNFVGKMPLSLRSSGTGSTMGSSGGSLAHTHVNPAHTHSVDVPTTETTSDGSHTHSNSTTGSESNHNHSMSQTGSAIVGSEVSSDGTSGLVSRDDVSHSHSHSHSDGSYVANTSLGGADAHSHGIINSSSTSTPSYTSPSRAENHYHGLSTTGSDGSHSHSLGTTGSTGSHSHNFSYSQFQTTSDGALNTNGTEIPYFALFFWIKT